MVKKACLFICCFFLFNACVPIEKVMFKKWNTLYASKKLKGPTKAVFKYNVISHLQKNPNLKFFATIDSTFVINLKGQFIESLNNNLVKCQNDTIDSRFEIEVQQFDFAENRYVETNTLDRLGTKREDQSPTGLVSCMEIHLQGFIHDRQTNKKKEIKIDDHFKTWLDTDWVTGITTVERGVNIKPNKRISNFIIEFSNECSEFIKNAD